jgi:putative Ca2+/H+ antiporter (TMEM165/GDT1 family)
MDWQLLGLSFITVFLSELGDKSQLAAIALSGSSKSPWIIFLGTSCALLLASFLGVLLGEGVAQVLPTRLLKLAAAIGFAIMALRLLWSSHDESEESESVSVVE